MARRTSRKTSSAADPSPPDSRRLVELAGERFAELGAHVARQAGLAPVRLGVATPVPLADLRPGVVAWSLRASEGFTVFYALVPEIDDADTPEPTSPIAHLPWTSFAFAEPVRGRPRAMLLVRADDPSRADLARRFGQRLRLELESDED